jgi:hypothetical protein
MGVAKMCFSATASFAAGTVISSVGIAAIRMNKEPSQRLFAAIPVFFGIQQVSEGFVWLALQSQSDGASLKVPAYIFLTVALVIWPTLIPLSVLLMEKKVKKRALQGFLAIGILVSAFYLIVLLLFETAAQISNLHILYTLDCPRGILNTALLLYVVATIPPLFVSSRKGVRSFGIVIAMSYLVTLAFFMENLVSVWCFFAALASVIIWLIVADRRPKA